MSKMWRRLCWGCVTACLLVGIAVSAWLSLTYEPSYYREIVNLPRRDREANAKQFVTSSLQLSNDIRNESLWEAVFSDQEVNAWLAQDLLTHFAEHIPPEVREPRVIFETDRIVLAFRYEQLGVETVITVIAKPRVPRDNLLELTIESVRAGILPVYADGVFDRIVGHARSKGIDVSWKRRDGYPVVSLFYSPNPQRNDVRLENLQLRTGQIRLAGRSEKPLEEPKPSKPLSRNVIQSNYPSTNRMNQSESAGSPPL